MDEQAASSTSETGIETAHGTFVRDIMWLHVSFDERSHKVAALFRGGKIGEPWVGVEGIWQLLGSAGNERRRGGKGFTPRIENRFLQFMI